MTKIWRWLQAIAAWLSRPFRRQRELPPSDNLLRALVVDEQPDPLDSGICYLIGEDSDWWFAAFACPCGCRAEIVLNLLPTTRPRWRVEVGDDHLATIAPSINRHVGCKSHFFIREGSVLWANAQRASAPTSGGPE